MKGDRGESPRTKQVALRMTPEELAKLDIVVEKLQKMEAYAPLRLTRSDALRLLVLRGLDSHE